MTQAFGKPVLTALLAVLIASDRAAPSVLADGDCGTVLTAGGTERAMALAAAGAYQPRGGPQAIIYVPLTFHVVRTSAGEGGLPADRICQALDDLDAFFFDAEIQFYLSGPLDYIDDDDFYYNIDSLPEINALRSTNVVPNTINVYFTENLDQGYGRFCGISSFTWSAVQGIVMENDCTVVWWNHTTFPHEVGHYFDLLHTHETAHGEECVDGSNCARAGDDLCDTPADPGLGTGNVNSDCVYFGNETDPCNDDPYDPDTTNLESGSRPSCRTSFTPQQIEKARATLFNLRPELVHDELPGPFDCNANRVRDDCDIVNGTSLDCNGNGIPDDCEFPGCPNILLGDMNCDGTTNGADIRPFVDALLARGYTCQADMDQDGDLDTNDVAGFVASVLSP